MGGTHNRLRNHLNWELERGCCLGSFAAWAMIVAQPGWRDLFLEEEESFVPVLPVENWMPVAL